MRASRSERPDHAPSGIGGRSIKFFGGPVISAAKARGYLANIAAISNATARKTAKTMTDRRPT
jgi:hypothetical protein